MKPKTLPADRAIVSGIDIITSAIAVKAEEETAAMRKQAEAEAETIGADYEEKARAVLSAAEEKAKKESAVMRERALSAAANHKRNLLLFQKGALVEEAFAQALAFLESLDKEAYRKLLSALLARAIDDYLAMEQTFAVYEGDGFVGTTDLYLVMAKRDLSYGKALCNDVSAKLAANRKRLTLGEANDKISSGFILIAGDIRMDSSLKTLIDLQKETLGGEVFRILFA